MAENKTPQENNEQPSLLGDGVGAEHPQPPKGRKRRGVPKFRRKQRATSVYFLLWSVFAAFALVVVLLFSAPQQYIFSRTYQKEASESVAAKGRVIDFDIDEGLPQDWTFGWGAYVRRLSYTHQVRVFLLTADGEIRYPEGVHNEPPTASDENSASSATNSEKWDVGLSDNIAAEHIKKIDAQEDGHVVYKGNGEYIYGSTVEIDGDALYLYVGQSLELMTTALRSMSTRIVLLAVFVFMLCFFVSSAVAGWLTKPMTEMTEKAHRLAEGHFDMDFHGVDYGKEMVELADALNFARDELSKTDRMQKELIANVSHDFKTPLTMIKAYASMIIEISGDIPEKRNKHAQIIIDETDRLTSLVSDVLDLSKISSGIQPLQLKIVDVSACVCDALRRFEYLKETQGYIFETEIEKGLFATVDEIQLGQALYNLIGNAVNYTGDDKRVIVRLKREEEGFKFSVTDTGAGIKSEDLGDIWERFYRTKESHKRPVQGTGLGLSIVKAILEKHELQFGVTSEVGKGSTFYVCFPELP